MTMRKPFPVAKYGSSVFEKVWLLAVREPVTSQKKERDCAQREVVGGLRPRFPRVQPNLGSSERGSDQPTPVPSPVGAVQRPGIEQYKSARFADQAVGR